MHDTKAEGKLVYINLTIHRYRCPECGCVFQDTFDFFDKNSKLTNRLKDEFTSRVINGETFSYIARDYQVDRKTVAAVFNDYVKAHEDELTLNYTPKVLGIDEAHIDDHYRLVLTDVEQNKLLDIKKDNKTATVKRYLKTLNPKVCKIATMDFAPAYSKAVSDVLPKTTIIIDKFHVVQELNRALDKTRIEIQNRYREEGYDVKHFKKSKKLFMANYEKLDVEAHNKLNQWFVEHEDLYEAYMIKESFRDIYLTAQNKTQASKMFDAWVKMVPDFSAFQSVLHTFIRRREHILNYFDCPWTNAYTESVNNQIKKIEKAGRGYKFETLRVRCMLEINHKHPESFNPRTAEYKEVSDESCMVDSKQILYDDIPKALVEKELPENTGSSFVICDIAETQTIDQMLEQLPHDKKMFIRRLRVYYEMMETLSVQYN